MSLDKISSFAITIVIMTAMAGNLDRLNQWGSGCNCQGITSAWGSPRFWPENELKYNKTNNHIKEAKNSIKLKN